MATLTSIQDVQGAAVLCERQSTIDRPAETGERAGRESQEAQEEEEDGKPGSSPRLYGLERTDARAIWR